MQSYIALGDSISIDSYPAMDAGLPSTTPCGAASILGRSLLSLGKIEEVFNLATDGATIQEVLRAQLQKIPKAIRHDSNLVTLTIGGNDISFAGINANRGVPRTGVELINSRYDWEMERITKEYHDIVSQVRAFLPRSGIILNTLYDPTDGLNTLPANCGEWAEIATWYSRGRRELGDFIRKEYSECKYRQLVTVVDIHKLFDGHGMAEDNVDARWYYSQFMIEPGQQGAIEIARAWSEIGVGMLVACRMYWSPTSKLNRDPDADRILHTSGRPGYNQY